ncbi:MAG: DUF1573 domain-containing protein [Planctomycetales bacterium]|nr:DUF1573 domain-containing protein [Planctomycetales bacterium]
MDQKSFHRVFQVVLSVICYQLFFPMAVYGQAWARDMFEITAHDFGTVPRGAKAEYAFEFVNKYEEPVHVASVRSSCKCTLPRVGKGDLKTYEKGSIIAEFNTRAFIGPRAAVVTVVIDRPFYAEVQLTVKGNIRSDIVTEPGEIQFGDVPRGTEKSTSVRVSYAGSTTWKITDVQSANRNLSVRLNPLPNNKGQIEYDMQVRLLESAEAGEFADEIVLVTNDTQYNLVTIPVRGRILPPVVLPDSVELGTVATGNSVQNRIVVTAKKPFQIVKVECDDDRFEFTLPTGERTGHIVPFQFTGGDQVGAFRQKVVIQTSLPEDGTGSTFVTGNVSGK